MAKVRISSDVIKPFSGVGDVVAWLKKVRLVARLQNVDDVASLVPSYPEGDALALYMEMEETSQRDIEQIESRLKEAFTDNAFAAYRKLTMVRWAGERVDVFANKIRKLIGLAGFKGAEMEKLAKLAFVTGFPNTISIELQQSPNIKAMTMGYLLARARVLTTTEDPNQNMIAVVRSFGGGATHPGKSGPNAIVTCYRCKCKGHTAKTAGSVECVATNAERMATGLETVRETRQGTRHQPQPSSPRRFEYDAPGGQYLRQRDAVFGASWYRLFTNDCGRRSVPVLEKSGSIRHDNWRHVPFVLQCRNGHRNHGGM